MTNRKSPLLGAMPAASPAVDELEAAPPAGRARAAVGRRWHVGAYFDPADPIAVGFRVLAAQAHRTQQDLVAEALADIVDKYRAKAAFGQGLERAGD
jgi:hypothetical protein